MPMRHRALSINAKDSVRVKSQLRFVMHPDDEAAIVAELLRDPAVLLVDGPRWKSATPPTTRNVSAVDWYCIIWCPADLSELSAEFIPTCNDWYCAAEYATIQFLRCQLTETVITEGRFAISTGPATKATAAGVERRYRWLRRTIQKTYSNSIVRWFNPKLPEAPREPSRSANPSKPEPSLWVGPAAMSWLAGHATRRIKQDLSFSVEGVVDQRSAAAPD
jgi:hypothetical protein